MAHCKGKLEILERGKIEDNKGLEAIRAAFEIELGGHAFYKRAAKESKDPQLQELFGRFAAMEQEHMQTLQRRYHAQLPASSPEFRFETSAIFFGIPVRPADPANLFRVAIGMEQRAAGYFEKCAQDSKPGSTEQQLYRELAAEEHEHATLLSTEYARWQENKPGLMQGSDEIKKSTPAPKRPKGA